MDRIGRSFEHGVQTMIDRPARTPSVAASDVS